MQDHPHRDKGYGFFFHDMAETALIGIFIWCLWTLLWKSFVWIVESSMKAWDELKKLDF